jgi:hypothetical protein
LIHADDVSGFDWQNRVDILVTDSFVQIMFDRDGRAGDRPGVAG